MYLAVHGHFRKSLTTALEHEWFDLQHEKLTIAAHMYKNGQAMEFKLSPPLVQVIKKHRDEQSPRSRFVFPSTLSKSGHRTNLDYQWYKLMEVLGLYEEIVNEVGKTTRVYKYRQHDFRDTLIDRLLDLGVDEQVMASALGHASLFSVTSYKKIKVRHKDNAAEQNTNQLVDKFTGMAKLQKDLIGDEPVEQDLHQERKDLSLQARNQTGTKPHRISARP